MQLCKRIQHQSCFRNIVHPDQVRSIMHCEGGSGQPWKQAFLHGESAAR